MPAEKAESHSARAARTTERQNATSPFFFEAQVGIGKYPLFTCIYLAGINNREFAQSCRGSPKRGVSAYRLTEVNMSDEERPKIYKRRWLNLLLFSFLSFNRCAARPFPSRPRPAHDLSLIQLY